MRSPSTPCGPGRLALWLCGLFLASGATEAATKAATGILTTAASVRALSPEEAVQGRTVLLEGNLALVTPMGNAIVLLDDTEGVYVELKGMAGNTLRPGDRLAVEGVTDAGDFAPMVRSARITRLGQGALPPPRVTTIAELNAGGFDAAWVELRGIVRSCVPTPQNRTPESRLNTPSAGRTARTPGLAQERWLLNFAQGDDQLSVQVNARLTAADLVDAEVQLRGVVFNVHNANRQFVRAGMQVSDQTMIEVVTAPPADPFAVPVQRVEELLRFSRTGFTGHRVHVHGVITGHRGRQTLWLQDGDRGLRVASQQDGMLAPGDEVDVVGFPDHGGYAPSLSDASFRKIRAGPPPLPRILRNPEEISRHDSNLVQIEAGLTELRESSDGLVLTLDWNGMNVVARLLQTINGGEYTDWQPGSLVRVSGICHLGENNFLPPSGLWVAEEFQLLLRNARDLAVIRPAPWLNTRRALFIVISVAVVMLLALVTVAVVARRQIAQREEARKLAEVEFSAMLAERNRVARDIHDTLAQELNAVSMQMELAKNCAKAGSVEAVAPYLNTAHQIVRSCLAAARESIWNMRSHILERTDLLGALKSVAEQMSAGLPCTISASSRGDPRRLAPMVENNLLRIGQEAVSNALKHARPRNITLEVTFDGAAVRLVIQDDGVGFDPAEVIPSGSQFGLSGMRERTEQMHGELRIGRGVHGGTRVEVVIPSPG